MLNERFAVERSPAAGCADCGDDERAQLPRTSPTSEDRTVVERAEALAAELTTHYTLDNAYREHCLSLTASENHPSKLTRLAGAAMHGAFYEFRPPYPTENAEWSFPESGALAALVDTTAAQGKKLFNTKTFDWRPNGGSVAEQAVVLGTCNRGDGFVHFAHRNGGHFALDELAKATGIAVHEFPVVDRTQLIDVARLAELVRDHREIKLVILDQSFKLRFQPIEAIRAALPASVTLAYDASHDGGLIAGGALPQPSLCGADIVIGNTHKTIPGPQKAFVAFRDDQHPALRPVSDWVCPRLQSNSHAELLGPLYCALTELALFGNAYARQTCANARALAGALVRENFDVAGEFFGYTETHQVHVVLGSPGEALAAAVDTLPKAGIRANNIEVPGANGRHGLRLGVQALTRRGLGPDQMPEVARFISRALRRHDEPAKLRDEVAYFLRDYPLHPLQYSLDAQLHEPFARRLLEEILAW